MPGSRPPNTANTRRLRLAIVLGMLLLVAGIVVAGRGGGRPRLPLPGIGRPARAGDPFGYIPSRATAFTARAVAGTGNVLFTKSPGGALATAARVAAYRPLIDRSVAGSGIDPNLLEGLVFVESAGRSDVIAGGDPSAAAGLTQILASTGAALLGMRIDLARSRTLTRQITAAQSQGQLARAARLAGRRAQIDDRFNPEKALAATVRYLKLASERLGRPDLAVVSYHMGIGNLQTVLNAYDGGRPVPYVQLYFDTAPDHHGRTYRILAGFGDDSSLYYWRVLGAAQIMRLYRTDRPALRRLAALSTAAPSSADVLHPPDRTRSFADPGALYAAYGDRTLLPLPSNARSLGLAYNPQIGWLASRVGAPRALYRGLRPAAVDLLIELADRVRALSGAAQPLVLASAVLDRRYEALLDASYPGATTGYSFQISRAYANPAQADAFQALLDRLSALNLIAWDRTTQAIDITVAADASQVLVGGP